LQKLVLSVFLMVFVLSLGISPVFAVDYETTVWYTNRTASPNGGGFYNDRSAGFVIQTNCESTINNNTQTVYLQRKTKGSWVTVAHGKVPCSTVWKQGRIAFTREYNGRIVLGANYRFLFVNPKIDKNKWRKYQIQLWYRVFN
jgi:hypothetical protein